MSGSWQLVVYYQPLPQHTVCIGHGDHDSHVDHADETDGDYVVPTTGGTAPLPRRRGAHASSCAREASRDLGVSKCSCACTYGLRVHGLRLIVTCVHMLCACS